MSNQLDQVSEAIGALRASMRAVGDSLDRHCDDDDRRHRENIEALRENNRAIAELSGVLTPLAKTVAGMQPIVASYQTSRLKLTGALGLALVLLGGVTWLAEQVIINGIKWFFGQH